MLTAADNTKIINENRDLFLRIMSILSMKENDPIVLTAVATFAKDLFETDDLMDKEEDRESEDGINWFEMFYKKIGGLLELIPYLGGRKYRTLLRQTPLRLPTRI